MVTHSSVLAWRIPGMGKPGGLPSNGVAQSQTRLKRLSSSSSSKYQQKERQLLRQLIYPQFSFLPSPKRGNTDTHITKHTHTHTHTRTFTLTHTQRLITQKRIQLEVFVFVYSTDTNILYIPITTLILGIWTFNGKQLILPSWSWFLSWSNQENKITKTDNKILICHKHFE